MTPDPKSSPRVKDPAALAAARAALDACAACGERASNVHHVIQRGSPHFGDDVPENFVGLCGSGTARCHGAHHGSPYMAEKGPLHFERRDAAWVNKRIGLHLLNHRRDALRYVLGKLGVEPGRVFLERTYDLALDDSEVRRLGFTIDSAAS